MNLHLVHAGNNTELYITAKMTVIINQKVFESRFLSIKPMNDDSD